MLPRFYQQVKRSTRGENTLDLAYTSIKHANRVTQLPHLGQSDHLSRLLTPAHTPRRRNPPITTWTEDAPFNLQDCFSQTEWSVCEYQDLEVHTEAVPDCKQFCTGTITEGPQSLCSAQLVQVFTTICNRTQATIPACMKSSTIIPVPKKTKRLILQQIKDHLPPFLDPYQFPYRANRSAKDTFGITLHITLSHLKHKKSYVRMVIIDFRSAVNTIIPDNMVRKLADLGRPTHTCHWIKDFLFNRPSVSQTRFLHLHLPGH